MKLRPYQAECVRRVSAAFAEHDSVLAVMATGTGKTVVFASLARSFPGGGSVLVLAHRDELIRQAGEKLEAAYGYRPDVEKGELRADASRLSPVVVSSVQTMCRPNRHGRFDPRGFSLVILDEAHHAVAGTYRAIIDYFRGGNPGLKVLGVTATPARADQSALGQVFGAVAYDYGIEAAIADGWLVPVRQRVVKVEGLDFSHLSTVAGDFREGELEAILTQEEPLHRVAASAVEVVGGRQAIIFCASVRHAEMTAAVVNRYRPDSAIALSGKTDPQKRKDAVDEFKAGKHQYLVNCGLFLEGFDAPATAAVVMARPTKSLTLYQQVLGRGTRPLPGVVDPFAEDGPAVRLEAIARSAKPYMIALDYVGNAGRHKIVNCTDIFSGRFSEAVKTYARKELEKAADAGDGMSPEDRLRRAALEMEVLEEQEQLRRRAVRASRASYSQQDVSPFEAGGYSGAGGGAAVKRRGEPATEKQVGMLCYLGVREQTARGYTKRQASAVIDDLQRKRGAAG